ncbi:hypothetical protein FA95DRAFT_364935 [Auriscalpium vulgare]|uniref:Uncharacterized protein n=1 Tax=Auriscalpium vulgare TaxID=40419 RepID=A0ACB8RJJ2_9AGAM|nr:hypothetical protein FA95DRAFT_364935 [Auriscalpium vulgare]
MDGGSRGRVSGRPPPTLFCPRRLRLVSALPCLFPIPMLASASTPARRPAFSLYETSAIRSFAGAASSMHRPTGLQPWPEAGSPARCHVSIYQVDILSDREQTASRHLPIPLREVSDVHVILFCTHLSYVAEGSPHATSRIRRPSISLGSGSCALLPRCLAHMHATPLGLACRHLRRLSRPSIMPRSPRTHDQVHFAPTGTSKDFAASARDNPLEASYLARVCPWYQGARNALIRQGIDTLPDLYAAGPPLRGTSPTVNPSASTQPRRMTCPECRQLNFELGLGLVFPTASQLQPRQSHPHPGPCPHELTTSPTEAIAWLTRTRPRGCVLSLFGPQSLSDSGSEAATARRTGEGVAVNPGTQMVAGNVPWMCR